MLTPCPFSERSLALVSSLSSLPVVPPCPTPAAGRPNLAPGGAPEILPTALPCSVTVPTSSSPLPALPGVELPTTFLLMLPVLLGVPGSLRAGLSAALAFDAAVPCINLDEELDPVIRLGVEVLFLSLVVPVGVGLPAFGRAFAPAARPRDVVP